MSASHISNKLHSLVLSIGQFSNPLHSEDEKQELVGDEYTKKYQSLEQVILSEDSLLSIFRHPLFKQSTDRELHTKIYKLIIAKTEEHEHEHEPNISPQIFQIMHELHTNTNYMSSLANVISQTLKWTRKYKELKIHSTSHPKPKPQPQKQNNEHWENKNNSAAAHDTDHDNEDTESSSESASANDASSSSCRLSSDNAPNNEDTSSTAHSSSSSCDLPDLDDDANDHRHSQSHSQSQSQSPTKPPLKEGRNCNLAAPANNNANNKQNNGKKKKNKRRSRRKKAAQNRQKNLQNGSGAQAHNEQRRDDGVRDYSHNFSQYDSSVSCSDPELTKTPQKAHIVEERVPPNKKACAHCTFHNAIQAKKCAMCGNKFADLAFDAVDDVDASFNINKKMKRQKNKERAKYNENEEWADYNANNNEWGNRNQANPNNARKGKNRKRKPRWWTCPDCVRKNKNMAPKCECGGVRPMEEYEWSCTHCTRKNHCNFGKCQSCGEKRHFEKEDWQCRSCYKLNARNDSNCQQCHKPKVSAIASASKAKTQQNKNKSSPSTPVSNNNYNVASNAASNSNQGAAVYNDYNRGDTAYNTHNSYANDRFYNNANSRPYRGHYRGRGRGRGGSFRGRVRGRGRGGGRGRGRGGYGGYNDGYDGRYNGGSYYNPQNRFDDRRNYTHTRQKPYGWNNRDTQTYRKKLPNEPYASNATQDNMSPNQKQAYNGYGYNNNGYNNGSGNYYGGYSRGGGGYNDHRNYSHNGYDNNRRGKERNDHYYNGPSVPPMSRQRERYNNNNNRVSPPVQHVQRKPFVVGDDAWSKGMKCQIVFIDTQLSPPQFTVQYYDNKRQENMEEINLSRKAPSTQPQPQNYDYGQQQNQQQNNQRKYNNNNNSNASMIKLEYDDVDDFYGPRRDQTNDNDSPSTPPPNTTNLTFSALF